MIESLVMTLAAALAPAPQATPPAPAEQDGLYIVTTMAAHPDHCNLAVAAKVDLPDLVREPGNWLDKCVAVTGYWQGRALFVSPPKERRMDWGEAWEGRRVGIYGTKRLLSSAPLRPRAYTAVGVVGLCESFRQEAVMIMGYCHYSDGPYIALAQMHRRKGLVWGTRPGGPW
jgi:hypothetical protein